MKEINVKVRNILKSEKVNCFYIVLSVLACLLTVKQLRWQISEGIRLIIYVALAFSLLKLNSNTQRVYSVFFKLWHRILLLLLEMYSTFAMVGMYILDSSAEYEVQYASAAYLMMSYIWVRPIVIAVLAFLLSAGNHSVDNERRKVDILIRLDLICIVVLPCIIFLIGFNPAITSVDSEFCFNMAHQIWEKGFSMQDWHPPFYVFVMALLVKICDSITFIVIVQVICFALVFVDGILYFYCRGFSKRLLIFLYCFVTFGINNTIQLITLWKDIPSLIAILWLTLLLIKYVLDKEIYLNKPGWYIQIVFALIFTALFRQNGILPAVAIIVLLPVVAKASKKMIATVSISILLLFLVKFPLYNAMNVESAPQLKFFSLANDIMYSYYRGDTISDKAMEIVNKVTENDPEHFEYNPYYVYYNGNEPSGYSVGEFLSIYIENAFRNPRDTVMAVLARNSIIWSIVRPIDEIPEDVNNLQDSHRYLSDLYPYRQSNFFTLKLTHISFWIMQNGVLYIIYWRTGIYTFLILLMLGILLVKIEKRRLEGLNYVLPFVPILVNLFALAVSSGWSDYRYFWPSVLISLFLLCYFIIVRDRLISMEESNYENRLDNTYPSIIICAIGIVLLAYFSRVIYLDYLEDRKEMLRSQTEVESYLKLLNYDKYEVIMDVRDTSVFELPGYKLLIESFGIEWPDETGDQCFLIIGQNNADILTDFNTSQRTVQSAIGELSLYAKKNETDQKNCVEAYSIYLDGEECYTVNPEENSETEDLDNRTDIRVWVRDRKSKEVIDYATFSYVIEDGTLKTTGADHSN